MAIPDILRELATSHSLLVTVHINPDGDAIGSLLGMTRMLQAMGKRAVPVSQDPVPVRYRFLPDTASIRSIEQAAAEGPYDALVILDAGDFDRIGDSRTLLLDGMKVINIDHHISNDHFGAASWIDTSASATCQMLVELYREAKVAIDPDTATLLYTGLMTDTGRFRFSNTTPSVFATAANLVSRGANPENIASEIFYKIDPLVLRVQGQVLSRYEMSADGKVALSWLADEEEGVDSEGFVDLLGAIEGVEIAVMLRPIGDKLYKASFRSGGDVNVSDMAKQFGGGGHAKAAGGKISGTIDEVKQQAFAACEAALKNLGG